MYDLHGKTALVTGAGGERGIGRAIAVRLAREGADVIVNDLSIQSSTASDWGGLTAVVQEIEALGRRALAIQVDISDADSVDRMVRQVLRQFGRIDILVNNAAAPAGRDRRLVVDL